MAAAAAGIQRVEHHQLQSLLIEDKEEHHHLINFTYHYLMVGHGGALVESIAFNRRVVGSTPALAAM